MIAKFAEHYFKGELLDGTPFNMERAKELTRLGIITIGVSIVLTENYGDSYREYRKHVFRYLGRKLRSREKKEAT